MVGIKHMHMFRHVENASRGLTVNARVKSLDVILMAMRAIGEFIQGSEMITSAVWKDHPGRYVECRTETVKAALNSKSVSQSTGHREEKTNSGEVWTAK